MVRFKFDESTCKDLDKALSLEWLETNGTGGYASSTILNCNTRKYHGLLVANLKNPQGRHVLLSWLEDSIFLRETESFFSGCQYPGVFHPGETCCLTEFRLDHFPQFTYEADTFRIHKTILMIHGRDRVLIRYDIERCESPGVLRIKPFLAYRGHHMLSKQNMYLQTNTRKIRNGFTITPFDGMPEIYLYTDVKSQFYHSPVWYNNFEYRIEKERGFECHEDLFRPGIFEVPVKRDSIVIISATLHHRGDGLERIWAAETRRREREASRNEKVASNYADDEDKVHVLNLIVSGQQVLVKSPSGRPTIIAGYHWFGDWGRDTLISLPGLTFCSGRIREGIAILISLGAHEKEGLLPNYFSDDETENAYNTVDTSLWYFWAVQQLLKYSGDIGAVKSRMWPVMKRILKAYMDGTVFNIHMTENGLLHAGDGDTHLTWMDATVKGTPVTPRWGYPVEINALWYNAVCFANELARRFDDHEYYFRDLPARIKESFVHTFWMERESCLGDVSYDGFLDRAIRPNQILAVSLPYSPLEPSQWKGVVENVMGHLLTPVGLRTLSPQDSHYKGRYEGDGPARDAAYHQGTVWPWLIAHFGEAYLKVEQDRAFAKSFLTNLIRSFVTRHMREAGIGCVSEIFDGDLPHRPNGCISQAWSVAGLIRLYTLLNEPCSDRIPPRKLRARRSNG
jgi:predicted glycogen debranching enzyme